MKTTSPPRVSAAGSTTTVNARITPSRRIRRTRSAVALALRPTRTPRSRYEIRASSRRIPRISLSRRSIPRFSQPEPIFAPFRRVGARTLSSMSELMTPAFAGAAAGLGVAMPMGAMSVLLIQEAMRRRRVAVAAAAGIAAVDLGYAAVATAVGPWAASHISPVEAWVRLTSALILLAIAAHGLTTSRPSRRRTSPGHPPKRGTTPRP